MLPLSVPTISMRSEFFDLKIARVLPDLYNSQVAHFCDNTGHLLVA